MAETPQPVDAGQSPAPTAGQEAGAASPPPPPSGYGWGGPWPPPPYGGWGGYWPPPRPPRGPLLKPGFAPGPVFIGLVAAVMTIGVLASSDPDAWLAVLSVMVGLNFGFVWIVAFIIGSQDTRLIISRRAWARWALPPLVFFVSVALIASGLPRDARFEMSRSALDHAAASAQAGTQYGSGWIGFIQVRDVRLDGDTTFFDTSASESGDGCAFVRFGTGTNAMSSWLGDSYNTHDYGGGWWYGCTGIGSD